MPPPYLLLDIDGVLIPFPQADGSTPKTHTRYEVVPVGRSTDNPVTIWLDPSHGPMIMEIIDTGLVTPVWCTSWREDASTLIGPLLNLPPLPHIDLPHLPITTSHPDGYLWKRDFVDSWLADAPTVWVDDDFTDLDHEWARERNVGGVATLLVQPHPRVGLQPGHLTDVMNWIQAPTTRVA